MGVLDPFACEGLFLLGVGAPAPEGWGEFIWVFSCARGVEVDGGAAASRAFLFPSDLRVLRFLTLETAVSSVVGCLEASVASMIARREKKKIRKSNKQPSATDALPWGFTFS